ncbi:peptidoglycan-binding protein LysM [Aliiroseovarius sp. YM-037]|uniref:peptidoglycan-binding protein LysM n=1 Tax=Aliiroseovarius sp. YM-037 TaxID=3341728 RepID=UPI003A8071D5
MGLWSFVKDSGKKLFGGGDEAPDADALKKEVKDLGLGADDVDISVIGDKVKVSGAGLTKAIREKVILAVGNVAGVAEVEDDGDDDNTVFHTVQKGENLSVIAQKTLGKASRYPEIFEANKPMLTHPDKIYPGQVLRIPQDDEA